ncbi:MAG: hypothetical protein IRY87_20095 [Acetobacteraceae bacterium]|nr:hypothetical protein [Acetobacteraceae bacterium]
MTARPAVLILLAALALPMPAPAQTRTLVVPDGAGVVVPPRGQAMPSAAQSARRLAGSAIPPDPDAAEPGLSPLLALVPLALGAVLATTLPGSGGDGGSSGPVRTR